MRNIFVSNGIIPENENEWIKRLRYLRVLTVPKPTIKCFTKSIAFLARTIINKMPEILKNAVVMHYLNREPKQFFLLYLENYVVENVLNIIKYKYYI